MKNRDRLCRLCLIKCDDNFHSIEENVTEILDTLQEMDLAITEEDELCANCVERLKRCSSFKSQCLDVENFIVQCINRKDNNAKPDLRHIYLSKETNVNVIYIPEDHDICRLCMGSLKTSSFIYLNDKEGEVVPEKMMLKKCLPKLDLYATDKPVICLPCCGSLQHYFSFITDCSIVEENIKKYCEATDVDNIGLVKLKDVLEFTSRNRFSKVDRIKVESKICEDEDYIKERKHDGELPYISQNMLINKDVEQTVTIKIEKTFQETECKIELKPENLREICEQQFSNLPKYMEKWDENSVNEMKYSYCQEWTDELKVENCEEMLDQKFTPCFVEVGMKTENQNLNSLQDGDFLVQTETNPNLPERQECSVAQPHENSSQVLLVKSGETYENEPEHILPQGSASEKVYCCASCTFQSKYKRSLVEHLLKHKDPSEVIIYKCDTCSFQTKYKKSLDKHNLTHPLEAKSFRCEHCSFESKHKRHIKTHMLIHDNPTETLYQCDLCSYQTKYKSHLKPHLLTHKDPSELTMHHCDICSHSTKRKSYLKRHMLIHKNLSEITMYKCENCSFQTKYKDDLKRHSLTHRSPSSTLYNCDFCSYQTKRKHHLRAHLDTHKDPPKFTVYQCDHCSYETKCKKSLENHKLLIHKDPYEIMTYSCVSCSFQTKHKEYLKTHILIHKDPSQVTMYDCDFCPYQSKHKRYLKLHLLTHKNPSEVKMHRCEFCPLETKLKRVLVKHIQRRHKNSKKPSK